MYVGGLVQFVVGCELASQGLPQSRDGIVGQHQARVLLLEGMVVVQATRVDQCHVR